MDAVILIDKPQGLTSQETVTLIKRRLKVKKAGHTGTLDPIATGLLPVCVGEATKIARFLSDLPKQYLTKMKLGERTETFDSEGIVIARNPVTITEDGFRRVLEGFKGKIKQIPPMYSAIKLRGKPLYELARKGIEVERKEREVEIYELELFEFSPPFAKILISCSKGTYVRTLVDDIGRKAGCYAHIVELSRTRVGGFRLEDAAKPEELPEKQSSILDIDRALGFLEEITLDVFTYNKAKNGAAFSTLKPVSGFVRLKDPHGKLFAIGNAFKGVVKIERGLHL